MCNPSYHYDIRAPTSTNRCIAWIVQTPSCSLFANLHSHSGTGYTALSGPTKLIDRSVLGVPGTPFALIMTRSLDFADYDTLMLLNSYNNRHVRLLLGLVQMAWDSVEGAGTLARPQTEAFPRVLMQAGLGDVEVPTIAAEALARGFDARTLPNNPRKLFGIPEGKPANKTYDGPHVTLTEMLYETQYDSLPIDDEARTSNYVHLCLKMDSRMQRQVAQFISTGQIVNPCEQDQCRRDTVRC
mmetsp:Transcript_1339/g.3784  ORF Transcript_1339/g.3784 Transcript_1339/m.3784 type:complete len:242 (-) Transcript_1339:388-1113(-)